MTASKRLATLVSPLFSKPGWDLIWTLESALLQHPRRNQLFLNMTLQNLNQKFSQVGTLRLRPPHLSESFHWRAKHLRGQRPRLAGNLGRRQALVVGTHQPIRQRVKI